MKAKILRYKYTLLYTIAILALSLSPVERMPKVGVTNFDKFVHFLMYFILVLAMLWESRKQYSYCRIVVIVLIAIALGVLIEFVQPYFNRSFELYDIAFNTIGALLCGLIGAVAMRSKDK